MQDQKNLLEKSLNPVQKAPKNYPHIMLKGDCDDVAYVIDLIEKHYKNPALHTLNLPIARQLLFGMVIELQKKIGSKYGVSI